jgi:SAM-dependent methyltransferase
VRERINLRISGDPSIWTTTWLKRRLEERPRIRRAMSVGCGMGELERDLIQKDMVDRITGVEIAPVCVAQATRVAAEAGMSDRIDYRCADAWAEVAAARGLDAIFFHASLHHFDRLDEMAILLRRALAPGGLLYLDEYVGPSRDEWGIGDEIRWNWHYYHLPKSVRRVGRIRPPINYEDPTEAVASSDILPAIEREFGTLERRDYGGNLLSVIYGNLWRPSQRPETTRADFDGAVARLLDAEDRLLAAGEPTYHAVLLAAPR